MKRILSLTLVLIMVLGMIPMASAENVDYDPTCFRAADHGKNKQTTPSTCTTAGKIVEGCDYCGAYIETALPLASHDHSVSLGQLSPATCKDAEKITMKCANCTDTITVDGAPATGNHNCTILVEDACTEATCEDPELLVYQCATAGCTFRKTVEGDPATGEHDYSGQTPVIKDANCSEAAATYVQCKNCTYVLKTPSTTDLATGVHTPGADGKCTTVLHDGSVCGATAVTYTLNMSGNKTVKVGQTVSVAATLDPATDSTIEYTTSDPTIATVTSGVVTGVSVGEVIVTAVAKIDGQVVATAQVTVTVTTGAYIECDNESIEVGSSETLAPAVKNLPTGATATLTLSSSSSDIFTLDAANKKLTGKKEGYGTVTISGYYKLSGSNTQITLDPITVHIGVYDAHTVEVTVKSTAPTSFDFDDVGIFSTAKYDKVLNTSARVTLESLLKEGDGTGTIAISETYDSDKIGTLKLNKMFNRTEIAIASLGSANFTLNGKAGTSTFKYVIKTAETKGAVTIATGTLSITSGQQNADITYKTGFKSAVTIEESDFATYFKTVHKTDKLDYVMFDIETDAPEEGNLYINTTATTANKADKNMSFYYQFNSATDKGSYKHDLDTITYVPNKYASEEYVDYVTFTCYGESGKTAVGLLAFEVGEENPFTDVKEDMYYYDAVLWAVGEGITNGISDTKFGPDNACTRGQVVTFLWRAAGEPEPKSSFCKFTDVKANAYYYDAVLWAVEEGITDGMTATTFAPDAACTRAQVVTFLYRAFDEPSATSLNGFKDVPNNAYFYNPVVWAVKNGITNGQTKDTFAPGVTCTRGQIVTFLYRAFAD